MSTYRVVVKYWDRHYGDGHTQFRQNFEARRSAKADKEAIDILENALKTHSKPQGRIAEAWAERSDRGYGPSTLRKYDGTSGAWVRVDPIRPATVGASTMRVSSTHGTEYRDFKVVELVIAPNGAEHWTIYARNITRGKALVIVDQLRKKGVTAKAQHMSVHGHTTREHVVRDFNTLDDLIAHAASDLGATHVSGSGPETKIYFPRGGQHPYEAASVRRKGGYWHADGPGARAGVARLPAGAKPIGGHAGRRAAEASRGKARKYWIVEQVQNGLWQQVGHFYWKGEAERFAATVPGKVRVVHTWPDSHDYPIEGGEHGRHTPRESRDPRRSAHKPLR